MPESKKLYLDIKIRFRDLDTLGHVNHLSILSYFEEGRIAFAEQVLGLNLGRKETLRELPFVMGSISGKFLSPVGLTDDIFLEIWVGKIRSKSFAFKYTIRGKKNKDKIFATGESTHVFFDFRSNQTVPISAGFLQKMAEYVECDDS
jgi:acyl-CoA thioester hydrolase